MVNAPIEGGETAEENKQHIRLKDSLIQHGYLVRVIKAKMVSFAS